MPEAAPAGVGTGPADAPAQCDVLVVGGGINGAGIARDLAGRGHRVLLCERDDLAAHTSSASTKLIHGGLRYLEYFEFGLVRKALAERERLLRSAPHLIRPMRFVMPHDPGMRPAWMIRAGLFLYDHLASRELLRASRGVNLREHVAGEALKPAYSRGFVYSDAWVDDARLVVANAQDAAERGATVRTRTACIDARRGRERWTATLQGIDGRRQTVHARALVNAAGPWAGRFLADVAHQPATQGLRLVKGSHLVVRRRFEHDHAYLFQTTDRRVVFAIPYEDDCTLIGTTDVEQAGGPDTPRLDSAEAAYLCEQVSRYFLRPVTPADVVWSYAGLRPLLDDEAGDPSAVTRDYLLALDTTGPGPEAGREPAAPLLTVWGGKLTTFRRLAEEAAALLEGPLGRRGGPWTRDASLPGGDLRRWIGTPQRPDTDFIRFVQAVALRHPELAPDTCRRLARAYGGRIERLLADGLGGEVVPGLYEAELRYLHQHEWARSAEDVLWRRTKLGLHTGPAQQAALADWCLRHWGPAPRWGEGADVRAA
ncbi:glycerol-3-phosphate dehydrogenase [Piscinibacter sakaiensis]|uniref:glycerol-3-phosphate dehydrogenase n=1 Tax=Piscinibacter sakaiensis TaxID=1547922 RepID=UPI0006B5D7F9|nr:glycerol-3-phosphate dehydrogenase [Piscinibacter sakaiensis]